MAPALASCSGVLWPRTMTALARRPAQRHRHDAPLVGQRDLRRAPPSAAGAVSDASRRARTASALPFSTGTASKDRPTGPVSFPFKRHFERRLDRGSRPRQKREGWHPAERLSCGRSWLYVRRHWDVRAAARSVWSVISPHAKWMSATHSEHLTLAHPVFGAAMIVDRSRGNAAASNRIASSLNCYDNAGCACRAWSG